MHVAAAVDQLAVWLCQIDDAEEDDRIHPQGLQHFLLPSARDHLALNPVIFLHWNETRYRRQKSKSLEHTLF